MKKTVVLVGPEASGNRWFYDILALHPNIEIIQNKHTSSFPREGSYLRHYPDMMKRIGFVPDKTSVAMVIGRDRSCTEAAWKRSDYNRGHPDTSFTFDDTLVKLTEFVNSWTGIIVFVSYELLLVWKEKYLQHLFAQIGVDPQFYPYEKVNYQDGNKKYIKEKT